MNFMFGIFFFLFSALEGMNKSLVQLEKSIKNAEKASSLCNASLKDSKLLAREIKYKLNEVKCDSSVPNRIVYEEK